MPFGNLGGREKQKQKTQESDKQKQSEQKNTAHSIPFPTTKFTKSIKATGLSYTDRESAFHREICNHPKSK